MGLKHYYVMKDAPLSEMLRKSNINIENQLIDFSDSSLQDYTDTGISIGTYIIFYLGGTIDYVTHVLGSVAQSSA